MIDYELTEMTAEKAAASIWEFEDVLQWVEAYFMNKDSELADYINSDLRGTLAEIRNKLLNN